MEEGYMSVLKNIRVAKKIGGGFFTVLALLIGLAGFGMYSLGSIESYFKDYRSLAMQSVEIGEVQERLLKARMGVLAFLQVGGDDAVKEVREQEAIAMKQAGDAMRLSTTEENKAHLQTIKDDLAVYMQGFEDLVGRQADRGRAFADLVKYGSPMEAALSEILESANRDGDAQATYEAALTLRHLLLARVYVGVYLVNNDAKSSDRVFAELESSRKYADVMRASLQDPDRFRLAEVVANNQTAYAKAFREIVTAINSRNAVFRNVLTTVGQDIGLGIDNVKRTAKEQQGRIGPAAMEAMEQASMMSIVIAIVAIVFGITAAVVIGRNISIPISQMTEAMMHLARKDMSVTIPATDHRDEVGEMAQAVQVFKDNMITADRLAAEQEKARAVQDARAKRIVALNAEFDAGITEILGGVASASEQLHATATTMSSIAEESNTRATTVAAAAEEAATNVQTVAAAAEELSASISEIGRQVQRSSEIANSAVERAENTHKRVQGLAEAATKIGEVVSMITDIAEQTNLLALNATIEAARAGDSGKGFAVVASEVKNLATQTARATEEIAKQIGMVQTETVEAVHAIDDILKIVAEINDVSGSIASAVQEQDAATQEIARNVQEAAAGTDEVTTTISGVSRSATEAGVASNEVLSASGELANQSVHLRGIVQQFLQDVRAA